MLLQIRFQRSKPLVEIKIVFLIRQAHVTAGRKHVVEGAHFVQGRGGAESGHVCVGRGQAVALTTPGVVGACDLVDVLLCKFLGAAVDEAAQVARVDEQDFVSPVAEAFPLAPSGSGGAAAVAAQKPQRGRYLDIEEEFDGARIVNIIRPEKPSPNTPKPWRYPSFGMDWLS